MLPVGSGRGRWPGNGGPPLDESAGGVVGVVTVLTSEWELGDGVRANFWESGNSSYSVS